MSSENGESVRVSVGVERDQVVMSFGTGKLLLPPEAARAVAEMLRSNAAAAEPPSGVALAAQAIEKSRGGGE